MLYRVKEKYFYEKQIEKDVDDGDGMCDAVGGNPLELWGDFNGFRDFGFE